MAAGASVSEKAANAPAASPWPVWWTVRRWTALQSLAPPSPMNAKNASRPSSAVVRLRRGREAPPPRRGGGAGARARAPAPACLEQRHGGGEPAGRPQRAHDGEVRQRADTRR